MKKLKATAKQKARRRLTYGSVSVTLTLLVIAAAIIANAAVSALAEGFEWYINMSDSLIYGIGDRCEDYLEDTVFPLMDKQSAGDKIEIILCDTRAELVSNTAQKYVFDTLTELCGKYPERFTIKHLNVWESPTEAKGYDVSSPSDVVFKYKDRHTTLTLAQFYVTTDGDTENPTAYNGEQRISSALLRIVRESSPICYFTVNHGESLDDPELMYLVADAGFNYSFLDMSKDKIPDDCELLVTASPSSDLLSSDGGSDTNETDLLDAYMSQGGKYIVFFGAENLSSGRLEHFEAFLSRWGVGFLNHNGTDGTKSYCILQDASSSLSADSLTFLGSTSSSSLSKDIFKGLKKSPSFGNAAAIIPSEGFTSDGNGSYINKSKAMTPLLCTNSTAEAWADGRLTDKASDTPFTLMSLTTEAQQDGKTAYLLACSSVDFCKEDSLQSNVYANRETLLRILSHMGYGSIPTDISSRPLSTPPIQSLTRKNAAVITALLCILPPMTVAFVGIFVIVRRRRA